MLEKHFSLSLLGDCEQLLSKAIFLLLVLGLGVESRLSECAKLRFLSEPQQFFRQVGTNAPQLVLPEELNDGVEVSDDFRVVWQFGEKTVDIFLANEAILVDVIGKERDQLQLFL